ncbi:EF-hand domain-containing protein [Longispora urticae]
MSSALLERKWDLSFAQLDVDRDGFADESDALALGTLVATGYGHAAGTPGAHRVLAAFRGLWDAIATGMDADGDGRVTAEEFRAGMRQVVEHERGYELYFQPAVEPVLDLADADADGTVSRAEWRIFQNAYGTPAADADAIFELLDTDGDGTLDRAELTAAIRDFYTSADPDAPGNHIYGRLH